VREQQKQSDAARIERLDALALSLAGKRRAAIDARANSGIEQIWLEDEDAFDGIDDLNRATDGAQGTRHRYLKSKSSAGTYTKNDGETSPNVCTLLPNITGPYTEAGAATIADMLLPLDDWPFGVGPTPIPELVGITEQLKTVPDDQQIQVPGMAQPAPASQVRSQAEQEMDKAKKCAEKAETRIKDWLTECQWHGKSRRQIDDAARVGSGITKGPIPQRKKQYAWREQEGGVKALEIREEVKPVTDNVDYWHLYPDYPACGENIHNGSFVFERGEVTKKTLADLRGQEGYIDSQIEICLREGPQKFEVDAVERRQPTLNEGPYEIWWFHGDLDREDAIAAGCDCQKDSETYISVPAVITMVNGHVIRGALNHLDKGSFPYDILVWRRRAGMPWGQGIARQIRPAQQAITACFRALMENAGLSAKPMLAVLRKYLTPTDGTWQLFGGKVFEVDDDADVRDVKAAILTLQIDSRQAELLGIIQFNLKLAEDITGQPLLLQGQQGQAPDTVGGLTIVNNNASVVKRRIARQFDDQKIEPEITRYYDYLMQYGEDEEEKGLFVIDARASSVLVERDIQNKGLMQLLAAAANPIYEVNPRNAYAEAAKAMKIDPARLQYTPEEIDKKRKEAGPPPMPQVEVAKIRAQADAQITAAEIESKEKIAKMQADADMVVAAINERLQSAQLTSEEQQTLAGIKATLAGTAIKIQAQERLSNADLAHDMDTQVAGHMVDLHKSKQVLTPPTEPRGRARPGRAFQQ
ncbi:MAG: gp58-like family protein, partial [Alphaproteobacteria bacterium]|nr:gp58-like family protein [Alphaproteobacteria bacterium]